MRRHDLESSPQGPVRKGFEAEEHADFGVSNRWYTDADKAECAERECRQRRHVYPRLIAAGSMTEAFANRQIAMMEEIAGEYRAKAAAESAAGRLL